MARSPDNAKPQKLIKNCVLLRVGDELPTRSILLAYKYTDARRWRRRIDNRRRRIKPFPVTIRLIIEPAMLIAVVVMTTSSVFIITPVVMSAMAAMVVSEGRHHVYTAD